MSENNSCNGKVSNVRAIREYFAKPDHISPDGHKPSVTEFKALTSEDKEELGQLARIELGVN